MCIQMTHGQTRELTCPTTHDSSLQVRLDLCHVIIKRLSFHNVKVSKEHATENRVPDGLINGNLSGDGDGGSAWQLGIQESVKVVTRGSVQQESKGSHTNRTHKVVGLVTSLDKVLRQNITDGETGQGSQSLGQQGLGFQHCVVTGPKHTHFEENFLVCCVYDAYEKEGIGKRRIVRDNSSLCTKHERGQICIRAFGSEELSGVLITSSTVKFGGNILKRTQIV